MLSQEIVAPPGTSFTEISSRIKDCLSFIATIGLEMLQYCFASCFRVDLPQGLVINTGSRTHMASNPRVVGF